MWQMIMITLPAALSSESYWFGFENYCNNGVVTSRWSSESHRLGFGNFPKQTCHEGSLAHVANDYDNITRGTLIRVMELVWKTSSNNNNSIISSTLFLRITKKTGLVLTTKGIAADGLMPLSLKK
jgi:hypothetical protein